MHDTMQLLQTMLNLPLMALVMARIGGLVIFAPFFSSGTIPVKTRVFLTAGIALVVLPFASLNIKEPENLGTLVAAMTGEMMIGMTVGLMITTVFSALELAGMMIGQQIGIGMAQVFDPLFNEESSVLGQLYFWLAMVLFLLIRGHIILIGALAKSFATLPVGQFIIDENVTVSLINILQLAFVLAIQISAPLIVAIFLTTLTMGFVARTVPQLNILTIGFSVRLVLGFLLIFLCLIPLARIFTQALDKAFMALYQVLNF